MLDVRCSMFISFHFDQTGRSTARGNARVKLLKLYPQGLKLFSDQGLPSAIGLRIGRTGVGDTTDGYGRIGYGRPGTVMREFADADNIAGFKVFYGTAQRPVTGGQQPGLFFFAQLIGRPVAPAGFDEL